MTHPLARWGFFLLLAPLVMHAQTKTAPADTGSVSRHDTATHVSPPHKSTTVAVLLSAACPGAGQFYNGSYLKVPVVLGFGLYFASEWLTSNRRYHGMADLYTASLARDPKGDDNLFRAREFYKDERDTFSWYFLILYFVNILDAYVDASLYGFDVSGDLSSLPATGGVPTASLRLSIRIP